MCALISRTDVHIVLLLLSSPLVLSFLLSLFLSLLGRLQVVLHVKRNFFVYHRCLSSHSVSRCFTEPRA